MGKYEIRMDRYRNLKKLSDIIGFKIPMDGLMTAITQQPEIDIIEFDKKLILKYNYEGSMKDFIKQYFGDEAVELVESLI
jgi:hypothetical protein